MLKCSFVDGMICLDIIKEKWSPINTVSMVLTSIQVICKDSLWWIESVKWSKSRESSECSSGLSSWLSGIWTLVVRYKYKRVQKAGKTVCREVITNELLPSLLQTDQFRLELRCSWGVEHSSNGFRFWLNELPLRSISTLHHPITYLPKTFGSDVIYEPV